MATCYYKTNDPKVLSAYTELVAKKSALVEASTTFAAQFSGDPIFSISTTRNEFAGIQPKNYADFPDKHLWTKPNSSRGGSISPRNSVTGKENKQKLAELKQRYYNERPAAMAPFDMDALFESIGTNWGNLMFSGAKWVKAGDYFYVATSAKLADHMVEILGSEYTQAERNKEDS